MIYLNLNIRNPWFNRFENVKNWAGQITKNKYWEAELLKTNHLVRFEFRYTIRQDHAGLNFGFGLLGWEFHTSIYDSRHWDCENKCWEVYGQSE
jgi:hypothetical protein